MMKFIPGHLEKNLSRWVGKQWYHQRFDGSPYFIHFIAEAQISLHEERKQGGDFSVHFCFYDNGKADWYMLVDEINKITESVIKNGNGDINFSQKLMAKWDDDEKNFYDACEKIKKTELVSLSDKELIQLHDWYVDIILKRNSSSSIIDGFALGTDEMIAKKIQIAYDKSALRDKMRFTEVFSIATAPVHLSFINNAEIGLLEIAAQVKKDSSLRQKLIEDHQKKYFWTRNNYVDANILSVDYFNEELDKMLSVYPDPKAEAKRTKKVPAESKKKKAALLKLLRPDGNLQFLLKVSEDFTRWQDERKEATFWTIHYGCLILKEISNRTKISFELLKYLSPREMSSIFDGKVEIPELENRKNNSAFYWDKEGHDAVTGISADDVKRKILGSTDLSNVNDFRGLTACLGKAVGKVKVIKSVKEISRVEDGDILVAVMTRPDYVPGMKKAAAIVTDEGGVTSHAAIVARELNKPCVIGTKIATKVLKDGMTVEVNANHGWIKIISK